MSTDTTQNQQLLQGRKLYIKFCSGCHNLHLPNEYNAEKWKMNLDEMQTKAKITDEEKQLIYLYLTSHSK